MSRILRTLVAACLLHPCAWQVTASAEPPTPEPGPPSVQPVPLVVDPGAPVAEPGSPEVKPAVPTATIPWRQTGRAETLELRGENGTVKVEIPIPEGVRAGSVSGQIGSAVNITAGRIDVLDGLGTALGTIGVPVDTPTAPFTVDTTAAAIENGLLTLNFVLRTVNPPADTCAPTPAVTLTRLATTLAGQPPPASTVADFLPPYLDAVTIWTGPNPSTDEQQAALTLTAMLSRSYRPIPVRVDVDTSAQVPPADTPGRRVITIDESDQSGIGVRNAGTPQAVLAVTGRGPDLIEQIGLFIDRRLALAQTPSVEVQSAVGLLTPTSTLMTFEQLGIATSTTFTGASTVYAGFDGAAFAVGPIERARVDLNARYTPTADDNASLLIKAGSYVLANRRLDQTGSLELTFEMPPQVIASDIGMALELQYFPDNASGCAPLNDRMTFAIDPRSTVEVTPGAAVGGFRSLPAALTPEFNVAVENPDLIAYAAQVINLLGQRTATLLRPQVIGMEQAVISKAALLAVTGGDSLSGLQMQPPVKIDGNGNVEFDGIADTGVILNGPVGVVQSFTHDSRPVLAVGVPGDRKLADATFDHIRRLESGWSSLAGDVVATGPAGDTVNLTVRTDRPVSARSASQTGWKWAALATAGVGAGVLGAVFRGLIVRRRRTRT